MSSRWVLSLVRLLSFCIAVVVARPALAAAPAIDRIVLVAETTAVRAASSEIRSGDRVEGVSLQHARPRSARSWSLAIAAPSAIPPRATREPIVVAKRYLRHCSLLC